MNDDPSELEKLLSENNVKMTQLDIEGKGEGVGVTCTSTSTVICAGNTCVRTLIIVAVE